MKDNWRHFSRHRPAIAGLIVLGVALVACLVIPWVTAYDPLKTHVEAIRQPPSSDHPFGTDELGRDLLVRLSEGGRISLFIGLAAMAIAILIGTSIGATAGYYGGVIDALLMRLTDLVLAIPQLLLLLILAQLLRSTNPGLSGGPWPIVAIVGGLSWAGTARLVRGEFLRLRAAGFVEGARMAGARDARIILRHILPNAASPLIVAATLRVGSAILTESTLSYLGFGVQPPIPTWGNMLRNAQAQMLYAPWTAVFPGLAILLTVLALNYLGDGLRDVLDPFHPENE